MKKKYKNSGFTLVEILVVVTLIAILSTFGGMALSGSLKKARDGSALSNIKALSQGLELYYTVNNKYPSNTEGLAVLIPTGELDRYLKGGELFVDNHTDEKYDLYSQDSTNGFCLCSFPLESGNIANAEMAADMTASDFDCSDIAFTDVFSDSEDVSKYYCVTGAQ